MAKILIADDEKEICDLLIEELSLNQHSVQQAQNGFMALELFHSQHFDLILSDVNMPFSNGIELLENIKNLKPDQCFLFMTGFSQVHVLEAYARGAHRLITKPFDLKNLITTLEWYATPLMERLIRPIDPSITTFELDPEDITFLQLACGGAYISTQKTKIPSDGIFSIQLQDPHSEFYLDGMAQCRWQKNLPNAIGHGIEFIHLTPASFDTFSKVHPTLNPRIFIPGILNE